MKKLLTVLLPLLFLATCAFAGEGTFFDELQGNGGFPCDNVTRHWSWTPPASYTQGLPVYIVGYVIANGTDKGAIADISSGMSISDGRGFPQAGEDHYADRTGGYGVAGGNTPIFFPNDFYMTLNPGQSINMVATCHAFSSGPPNTLMDFGVFLVQKQPCG